MGDFQLNILGCGSATPTPLRNPSAQVVRYKRRLMMIDCGEGTQAMMRRMNLPFNRLTHIFISHLHGDHCLGLPGLISTMSLHEKGDNLTVVLPAEGIDMMKRMTEFFCREASFNIDFIPAAPEIVADISGLTVEAFPLYHRMSAFGYIFREKPKKRHIRGEMMDFYQVPLWQRQAIKEGADFITAEGETVPNSRLTTDADPALSYAYCSDTVFDPRVAEAVRGVDLLYHESTYDSSLEAKARQRGHSTAAQAGKIAAMAGVHTLILGHFSQRYSSVDILVEEASREFPNVIAARDGLRIDICR